MQKELNLSKEKLDVKLTQLIKHFKDCVEKSIASGTDEEFIWHKMMLEEIVKEKFILDNNTQKRC